jgi:hypothetical protein
MAQLASLPYPSEPLQLADELLAGDHIGFDAWLLPPEIPSQTERAIHACSVAAGPIAFVGALTCVLMWIA